MLAQIAWLFVSNALILVLGVLFMEAGFPLAGLGVVVVLLGGRHWNRRRPGKGYGLLPHVEGSSGMTVSFGLSRGPRRRVTLQENPGWFRALFVVELAVVVFLVWGIVQNPSFRENEALKELVECRFGPGVSERCFR